MKPHDLVQGTDAWHQFRQRHFGASEAAAMLGLSKHTRRTELLHAKKTGTAKEYSDWFQKHVLDHGHAVEALARPIMEAVIGDDLYPVTCSEENSLQSASCDGLTIDGSTAWECKQWNESLADGVRAGLVPDTHMPQCQQILKVTKARRLLFTVSDGTPERTVWTEVLPDPAWFERLDSGWDQFARDLDAYVPAPAADVVVPHVETLPAVSVRMEGALSVASNLDRFGVALRAFVERIPKAPSTDQEFADTDAACRALKAAEDQLEAQESGALASIASVEEMRRVVAELRNLARTTRLAAEKVVQRRKDEIKAEIIASAVKSYRAYVAGLEAEITPIPLVVLRAPDWIGAAKLKRTVETLRDAVDTELASAKIAADQAARAVRGRLTWFREAAAGHELLFADLQALVYKPDDDFQLAVRARIAQHEEAERKRQEAATAAAAQTVPFVAAQPVVASAAPAAASFRPAAAPAAAAEQATLKLGDVCARLGFTMTADFVRTLGVAPAKSEGRTLLFTESQFRQICAQLVAHIQRAAAPRQAAAPAMRSEAETV